MKKLYLGKDRKENTNIIVEFGDITVIVEDCSAWLRSKGNWTNIEVRSGRTVMAEITLRKSNLLFVQGMLNTLGFEITTEEYKWRAEENEYYIYINDTGEISNAFETNHEVDNLRFEKGNYFEDVVLAKNSKFYKVFND